MPNELTIKIAGEAGQGLQTIGNALCRIFHKAGLYFFADQDYMSRVRGGNNFFRIRVSTAPVHSPLYQSDITVCLDKASVDLHLPQVKENGLLILDQETFNLSKKDHRFLHVPLHQLAQKTGGGEIYINSVASGLIAGLLKLDFTDVEHVLTAVFNRKGQEIIHTNIAAAEAGYQYGRDNQPGDHFFLEPGNAGETWLLNGSEALGLGAIKAGCKFYSSYPMTPSTGILNYLAGQMREYGIVVEQAEDEIAAINMVIGASFAGVRAMTATSGGGFCLMTEGLSLAAMTETPVVMVDAQRPGPATGFPTRTEQADLEFVIHAGHGEFSRAVFAPGTMAQAFGLIQKAFNLAEKYQIPVIVLTDQLLADSYQNIAPFPLEEIKIQRHFLDPQPGDQSSQEYQRYQLTESGISPRALPSLSNAIIYADSDEHTELGHITEDAGIRQRMVEKRLYLKMKGLETEVEPPTAIHLDGCDLVLMGFGSTFGVMKEAAEQFEPGKIGVLHLSQVWPFPKAEVMRLLQPAGKVVTVENNASAQLSRLLLVETGIKAAASILKYDGRPFCLDELVASIGDEVNP